LCAGWKRSLLQSVGWLEKILVLPNFAGAGAVTEMEVLLHSAWFRLEAVCRLDLFLLLQSVWLAGKILVLCRFWWFESLYLLVDLRGYEEALG